MATSFCDGSMVWPVTVGKVLTLLDAETLGTVLDNAGVEISRLASIYEYAGHYMLRFISYLFLLRCKLGGMPYWQGISDKLRQFCYFYAGVNLGSICLCMRSKTEPFELAQPFNHMCERHPHGEWSWQSPVFAWLTRSEELAGRATHLRKTECHYD